MTFSRFSTMVMIDILGDDMICVEVLRSRGGPNVTLVLQARVKPGQPHADRHDEIELDSRKIIIGEHPHPEERRWQHVSDRGCGGRMLPEPYITAVDSERIEEREDDYTEPASLEV